MNKHRATSVDIFQGSGFRGVIFDFNGVLWWDTHLQERSWRDFSAMIRGTPFTDDELEFHVHGRNSRHTLEHLTGRSLVAAEVDQLTQQKETVYRQMCLAEGQDFTLSPGAIELLDFLVAHGVPRTIATASEKTNVDFFYTHLDLGRWFSPELVIYDDGTRAGKPAPDFYVAASAALGLSPVQCIVVEDSVSGLQAAHAAGVGYVVALGPVDRHSDLASRPGVDVVVTSLVDFPRDRLVQMPSPE